MAEHFLGKEEVTSSILVNGSRMNHLSYLWKVFLSAGIIVAIIFIYKIASVSQTSSIWVGQEKKLSEDIKTKPILFLGDIMVGRYVETLMNQYGKEYPFSDDIDMLLQSHVTIANLEGPIPEQHIHTPLQGFQFSFPSTTPAFLEAHGIRAVSLANNHSMDWGMGGYIHTKKVLDAGSVAHFGGYTTTENDYYEVNVGTTTAIVYGINTITNSWNKEKALAVTTKLRNEHPNSYLIAFLHWGEEYTHTQNDKQITLAHELIDAGVSAIIGSHPHVVQGIESYKKGIIFYSLGNFIFDQYFSQETQEGYVLSLSIQDNTMSFTLIPTTSARSKVSIATSTKKASIVDIVANNSIASLHDQIQNGYVVIPRMVK
jgi:poly-gamma-glutamate capsule biosynthesis protein CapA/YwtB (metallophosphatase superfamily)